jgi:hypothetical protein
MTFLGRLLLTIAIAMALVSSADASGIGGYVEWAGTFKGNFDGDNYDEDIYGAGISYDTNVARDEVFNYRLDLGYRRVEQNRDDSSDLDLDGFALTNTLGFALARNEKARLWIGPLVLLSFGFDSHKGQDILDVGFGGGPAMGLTVHASDRLSIVLAGSYQFMYAWQERNNGSGGIGNADGERQAGFIRVYALFRLDGDKF